MKNRNYSPAKIRSASFDADAHTVDVIWSTGADVERADYDGVYIERLLMGESNVRLGRLNSGAPFLGVHKSDSLGDVIGSVVPGSARIENGRGVATIKLSSAASDADTITKIREGVIANISVGYLVHASTRIAGEKGQPDVIEISDWEPLEVSAVPIPADPGARIRKHGANARQPLSRRERRFRNGAAEATRLLQSARTTAEAKGAAEARKLTAGTDAQRQALARGAREARKLLRK